jgi:(R,R)-butanediol dehydrogenase/meso-butanediol dehydrogenase/diacetyl reductase
MRAAVLRGGKFVTEQVPDPVAGPGELVLRIEASGICGSDLKMLDGAPDGVVLGHEFVGEIVALGEGVTGWSAGEYVAALPAIGCGTCGACVAGDVARCATAELLGVGGPSDGAFAEFIRVSAREAARVAEHVARDQGALVEPLAVGLHAVNRGGIRPGDRVLVIGAGPVGLACLTWLRSMPLADLAAVDPQQSRRNAAEEFGATATYASTSDVPRNAFDVVIECVGKVGLLDEALGALANYGRIVMAGVSYATEPFMPLVGLMKEADVRWASFYTRGEYAATARLLSAGELRTDGLITGRIGFDDLDATFAELRGATHHRKVIVVP